MNPNHEHLYNYNVIDKDFMKQLKLINKDGYKKDTIKYYQNKFNIVDENISKSVYLFCTESEDKYIKMSVSLLISSVIECYNTLKFEVIELHDFDVSNYKFYKSLIQDRLLTCLYYLSKIYEDKENFIKKSKIDDMIEIVKNDEIL